MVSKALQIDNNVLFEALTSRRRPDPRTDASHKDSGDDRTERFAVAAKADGLEAFKISRCAPATDAPGLLHSDVTVNLRCDDGLCDGVRSG